MTRQTGRLPRLTRRSRAFDATLALALALIGARYVTIINGVDWTGSVLLVPLASAPLALRRRVPLTVLWTVMVVTPLIRHSSQDIALYGGVVCVVAAYSAVAHCRRPVPTLLSLPVTAAVLVILFTNAKMPHFPNGVIAVLILVPVLAAAYEIRMWRRRVDEGRARLSTMERQQVEALNRAIEHERARIARELHDVVTHNVGVMVIQAGAARKIMDTAPDQAREALLAVEAGGRDAMTELGHVMGLLTMDEAPADLTPQPGLNRLDALIGGVRHAGMTVELTVTGHQRPVPPGVELAAYRVVQEALTNTVKHASGATAGVVVDYAADHLRVEVTDTGGRPSTALSPGRGRGLIGLRERLALYGGTIDAGPRPSGGYRVKALMPLETP
ncbi:histidine kinase [Actinoallomurus purpureus]|uniref:sensor histidine kinase n=1 Tax=Actinoallomurus purpureus TaxID=478114 RepID=UPI002092F8D9|nr:histidine kinase [Actinoallomurus purpureus]MCO6009649.1 histidine kinase [Actinoallomurus purpureus]